MGSQPSGCFSWGLERAQCQSRAFSFLPSQRNRVCGRKNNLANPAKVRQGGALQEFISKLHPCTKHSGVDPAAATLKMGVSVSSSSPRPFQPALNTTAILPWQGWHNFPVTCAESQPAGAGGAAVHQGAVHERFLSLVASVLELRGHRAQFLVAPPEQRTQAVT